MLKVHSRCNLSCSYCYVYHGEDGAWRERPRTVTRRTVRRTADRIAEHVRTHRLTEIRVDLHGGEPLLAGADALLAHAAAVREAVAAAALVRCAVHLTVQTNGILLTEDVLARLAGAGIRVGLSLDGGTAALNRRRVDHAGRPSWPAAARAAALLAARPDTYAGLLCTVDVTSDPAEVLTSLAALGPPRLDLLLPHGNWTNPPPGLPVRPPETARAGHPTPYGDWLATAFDLWWARGARPGVRLPHEPLRGRG